MEINVLNGIGFSRVTPDPNSQLGGFNRVNKTSSDTYLSGFRLNSTDYYLAGRKERQERRENRQERREDRKENRQERKEARSDRREDRQSRRAVRKDTRSRRREARTVRKEKRTKEGGVIDRLLTTGKEVWADLKPSLINKLVPEQYQELAHDMMDQGMHGEDIRDELVGYMEEDGYDEEYEGGEGEQKGLFNKKSWWEKRSTGEKAAMIGGAVLIADIGLGGPISTNVLGMKKKKRK